LPLGWSIGWLYDGRVLLLVAAFAILGAAGLIVETLTQRNSNYEDTFI